ncbi:glycoside hydrolase family 9 protein [Labilibaculum euxinus]
MNPMWCRLLLFIFLLPLHLFAEKVIRINQLGYLPNAHKSAVFLSDKPIFNDNFYLFNSLSGKKVFEGKVEIYDGSSWGKQAACRLDFSKFKQKGGFFLKVGETQSKSFRIDFDIYDETADFLLNYMRQQRCGYNPFLKDSCHVHDGIIVDHPTRSGEKIDVTGGWHDASDYLQYVTTSANAVYQMLFAYQQNPEVFSDRFNAKGLSGANGIPDILDEARWGLDWLYKMNPAKNEMYNQIADDRDHRGFRLPTQDTVDYGFGEYRPVYFVTGKPQGLGKYKNRSTGVASTAAKYVSCFALGAKLFQSIDADFAGRITEKAIDAWECAKSNPGVCQTACVVSPYFYEEDNYVDDMELAASSLYHLFGSDEYQQQARYWGELEPVTPWMELHRARHYQYYPFVNLGHTWLAQSQDSVIAGQFVALMKQGLDDLERFDAGDPFCIGVPFQWCSNNFVVAAASQARLYRLITGDEKYAGMEAALTDWLFGCNPWGTSMVCGLPAGGDYPEAPHSSITFKLGQTTTGGLVDGPVYKDIYEKLRGIELFEPDEYSNYQEGKVVYHDDIGDYSSNEPTMDGTASLTYLLSSLDAEGQQATTKNIVKDEQGAVVRMDTIKREIYFIFSAHNFNDGGLAIEKTLKEQKVLASFFFTGDFYSNPENQLLIKNLIADGHYLGAHSDKHLLYADWYKRDSLLLSRDQFETDLKANYRNMEKSGVDVRSASVFLPPYEWYNSIVVDWSHQLGLSLINFTPGIRTNADYTTPNMLNYRSSETILNDLEQFEINDPNGLNGCVILVHLGTDPARTDKFYNRMKELIISLKKKGYKFARFGE